jgi:hypothetical protein
MEQGVGALSGIIIPIITLIVGAVLGFIGGIFYLRRQITKMQMDPKQMQQMARQMGFNLNQKQMNQAMQMMKKQQKKR